MDKENTDETMASCRFVQENSHLLAKLPFELIAKILKMACTSEDPIRVGRQVSSTHSELGEWRIFPITLPFRPDPLENPGTVPEALSDLYAISRTCWAFHNIVLSEAIGYKDNVFEFSSFTIADAFISTILPTQRKTIQAISLARCQRSTTRSQRRFQAKDIDSAAQVFRTLGKLEGLRSLAIDAGMMSLLSYGNRPFLGAWAYAEIRGLEHFELRFTERSAYWLAERVFEDRRRAELRELELDMRRCVTRPREASSRKPETRSYDHTADNH